MEEKIPAASSLSTEMEQLQAVVEAMSVFLKGGSWHDATASLLHSALRQTESEYGFVGVLATNGSLRVLAHEGIQWHPNINRQFYEQALVAYKERGYLEFTNFKNLFGRAITTARSIIANDPASNPHSGGIPEGHPPLNSFLGVPMLRGTEVIGLIGLANRHGGFSKTEQEKTEVLAQTGTVLYEGYRRQAFEDELREQTQESEKQMALMRAREDFMFTLTHDLKNPLIGANRILGQLVGGEFGALPSESKDVLSSVQASNTRLVQLIQNIIDVYRYEKDSDKLELSDTDFGSLVSEGISEVEAWARSQSKQINFHLPPIKIKIGADACSIKRVLHNLLDNAIKFSPEGTEIDVHLQEQNDLAVLSIHNFGEPITPEDKEFLFQRFWQGKKGKTYVAGSGLGLYLCHKIIAAHHGKIECQSEKSQGTTFAVSVPVISRSNPS